MKKYNKFEEGDLLILKKDKDSSIKECKVIHVILNNPNKDGVYGLDNDYYNLEYYSNGEKIQNWMDMGFINNSFEIDIKKLRKQKLDKIK